MKTPCASATRRSTRRSTFRAAARSSASWSPACAPGGHCAFPALALAGGPLADHHLGRNVAAGPPARARAGNAQCPPGAQAGDQLALVRAAALNVERLVDRLVADAHGVFIGELHLQPVRDLLRTPGARPSPGLAPRLVSPFPGRRHRSR